MRPISGFDAYSPEFVADPYPTYRRLLAESPVLYDDEWGLTFVARHSDVSSILRDRERFGRDFRQRLDIEEVNAALYRRIYPPQWPTWTRYIRESFIDLEPPRHTRLRHLVSAAFTRRSSESFRRQLEAAASTILDRLADGGQIEVIRDYATPLPVAMIAELMGIPGEDHPSLLDWSHAIVRVFDGRVTEEEGAAAERATAEFVAYLEALVSERRKRPGDDLISGMLAAGDEGDSLSDEEIVGTAILTLNAGHEATVHAVGNSILALAGDPEAYRLLREGGSIAAAVDELLRYDSPLQMFERWALDDAEVGGVRVAKGSKVGLLFGSANHDPEVFDDPERLYLERAPNPHVSFGGGLHYCVGAPLARVELESAIGQWVEKVASMGVVSVGDRIESLVFRGVTELRVEVAAA